MVLVGTTGPEPFIKPLVKTVRAEFKTPSRVLYAQVADHIRHQFATLNQPVTLDMLPVTAVHVASVLPPSTVGSLTNFGRRIGLAQVAALERADCRNALHNAKTKSLTASGRPRRPAASRVRSFSPDLVRTSQLQRELNEAASYIHDTCDLNLGSGNMGEDGGGRDGSKGTAPG